MGGGLKCPTVVVLTGVMVHCMLCTLVYFGLLSGPFRDRGCWSRGFGRSLFVYYIVHFAYNEQAGTGRHFNLVENPKAGGDGRPAFPGL